MQTQHSSGSSILDHDIEYSYASDSQHIIFTLLQLMCEHTDRPEAIDIAQLHVW